MSSCLIFDKMNNDDRSVNKFYEKVGSNLKRWFQSETVQNKSYQDFI